LTKQAFHTEKMVRCILFDFGNTLWTSNPKAYENADRLARQHAVQVVSSYIDPQRFPVADLAEFGLLLQQQIYHEARQRTRQQIGDEPDFADTTITALEQLGLPRLDRAAGDAIFEALRIRIPETRFIFPDTYTTLAGLQERGYILGVVTNRFYGGESFQEDMRQIGFDRYFDLSAMAVSADLGVRKPNPDIFLHALRRLGVSPHEAVMVGDSLHADIRGANRLDMLSVWRAQERVREELRASYASGEQGSEPQNADDLAREKEAVLQRAQTHSYWEPDQTSSDIRPDAIIYHLSELLELF
jgi:HAD superfamily hydrolase (TIGR01662 family)